MKYTAKCDRCGKMYGTNDEADMHFGGRCSTCVELVKKSAEKINVQVLNQPRKIPQRVPHPLERYYRPDLARDTKAKTFY